MTISEKATGVLELADALRPVLLRLARQLRRENQGSGLSPLDSQLLASVRHNPGIGVSELADIEQMSAPTMSAHVKRLEEDGFIARDDASCADKRRTALKITRGGEKALETLRKRRNNWIASRLASLSEKERQALFAAIEPLARLSGEKT